MPVLIPLTSAGNREITVNSLGGGVYRFRAYFSQGIYDGWFVDISDPMGTPLLKGMRIVPGCPNLLKGQGDKFQSIQLACAVIAGNETLSNALGNGTYLIWFNPGEINPFNVGDPLIDIPYDQWAFHQGASNRFFDSDGEGNIYIEDVVLAGSIDKLANLGAQGDITIKPTAGAGTENEYFRIDENGNMVMKG